MICCAWCDFDGFRWFGIWFEFGGFVILCFADFGVFWRVVGFADLVFAVFIVV